jgi:hypothetical protein
MRYGKPVRFGTMLLVRADTRLGQPILWSGRHSKAIAQWKGETQLALSLQDAIRAAASIFDIAAIKALTEIIEKHSPQFTDASLNRLIGQAIVLGQRMRGTHERIQISTQLFELVRKCGARISRNTVQRLVTRGETYSRVEITALGILYGARLRITGWRTRKSRARKRQRLQPRSTSQSRSKRSSPPIFQPFETFPAVFRLARRSLGSELAS